MILTHCPFVATPDSSDWQAQSRRSPTYKGDAKYFGDMVAYVDKTVGKLKTRVEQLGLAGNTVILFTGDNGTELTENASSAKHGLQKALDQYTNARPAHLRRKSGAKKLLQADAL